MATNEYTIKVSDEYVVPEGQLTKNEYIEFVVNQAAESYTKQYSTSNKELGIEAALEAYNQKVMDFESDTPK